MSLLTILSLISLALSEPVPYRGDDDHHNNKRKCLSDDEARDFIERYKSNFETLDEASVIATFAEDFTYESDSTSFFFKLDVSIDSQNAEISIDLRPNT